MGFIPTYDSLGVFMGILVRVVSLDSLHAAANLLHRTLDRSGWQGLGTHSCILVLLSSASLPLQKINSFPS